MKGRAEKGKGTPQSTESREGVAGGVSLGGGRRWSASVYDAEALFDKMNIIRIFHIKNIQCEVKNIFCEYKGKRKI